MPSVRGGTLAPSRFSGLKRASRIEGITNCRFAPLMGPLERAFHREAANLFHASLQLAPERRAADAGGTTGHLVNCLHLFHG